MARPIVFEMKSDLLSIRLLYEYRQFGCADVYAGRAKSYLGSRAANLLAIDEYASPPRGDRAIDGAIAFLVEDAH
jgi:hypothetical protein